MANTTTSMVVPVDSAHQIDEGALLRYLQRHVKGCLPPPASLQLSQVTASPYIDIIIARLSGIKLKYLSKIGSLVMHFLLDLKLGFVTLISK